MSLKPKSRVRERKRGERNKPGGRLVAARTALMYMSAAPAIFILSGLSAAVGGALLNAAGTVLWQANPTVFRSLSLLELIWLVENGLGLLFTWHNRAVAHRHYEYYRDSSDERDCIIAEVKLLVQNAFLVLQAAFVFVGLVAAFSPPPQAVSQQTVASLTALVVFILGPAFLTFVSWKVANANARFRRIVEKEAMRDAERQSRMEREAQKAAAAAQEKSGD